MPGRPSTSRLLRLRSADQRVYRRAALNRPLHASMPTWIDRTDEAHAAASAKRRRPDLSSLSIARTIAGLCPRNSRWMSSRTLSSRHASIQPSGPGRERFSPGECRDRRRPSTSGANAEMRARRRALPRCLHRDAANFCSAMQICFRRSQPSWEIPSPYLLER